MPGPRPPDALGERILALLADGTPHSTDDLAAAVGVDRMGVTISLGRLKHAGRIVAVGTAAAHRQWGSRQPSVVWRLAATGERENPMAADTFEARVLALLGDGTPRSTGELVDALGMDVLTVRECLDALQRQRRVLRVGYRHERPRGGRLRASKTVRYAVWTLP